MQSPLAKLDLMATMLIFGSIGCALALKFGGEAIRYMRYPRPRNRFEKFHPDEELLK